MKFFKLMVELGSDNYNNVIPHRLRETITYNGIHGLRNVTFFGRIRVIAPDKIPGYTEEGMMTGNLINYNRYL